MHSSLQPQLSTRLRQARRDDCTAISRLIFTSCHPGVLDQLSPAARQSFLARIHPDALRQRLRQDCCYWLIEEHGCVIATLGLQQGFHLRHLFVAPEHQRQGLASELWQQLQQLRRPRYFSVYAWPDAVPLYYHWGFRPMGKTVIRAHMPVIPMLRFAEQG